MSFPTHTSTGTPLTALRLVLSWTICSIALMACGGGAGSSTGTASSNSAPSESPTAPAFSPDEISGPGGTTYAYLEPSTRLALTHQHGHDLVLFGRSIVPISEQGLYAEFHTFDSNNWVRQKISVDFDGWLLNGDRQFDRLLWLSDLHLKTPTKAYAAFAHQTRDRLVFMSVDGQTLSGTYQVIDFGQPAGSYGAWWAIDVEGGWLLARAVRTGQTGPDGNIRLNVQIVKLDSSGKVTGSRWLETSNIPGFGFAQIASNSSYTPYIQLHKHFSDVLISGFAQDMQPAQGNPLQSITDLWLALDPASLSLRRSFWIQADRFSRTGYNEQPKLNLWAWSTEGVAGSHAWQPRSTFQITRDFNAYTDSVINQGWLRGSLSPDYSSFNLTAYGLRTGTPAPYVTHFWESAQQLHVDVRLPDNRTGTMVGNTSRVYPLPETRIQNSECAGTPGLGRFGQTSDCRRFDSYYAMTSSDSLVVRNAPANLSVNSVWDSVALDITSESSRGLTLLHPTSGKGVLLDLNTDYHHPGCTSPRNYTAPPTAVLSSPEVTRVRSTELPAVSTASITQQSGDLRVKAKPYQYRAPVLCSTYKVSLDQRLTMPRATDSQPMTVQPVLHPAYSRQVLTAPTQGTYDAATNTYRPRSGFTGTDSLRIRVNDGTGEQDVLIQVRVQ